MTFDDMLEQLTEFDPVPRAAIAYALDHWEESAPRFRAMLRAYIEGSDLSERTEMALYAVAHLLGEQGDTASFPDVCRLGESEDKLGSVFGPDASVLSYPSILGTTFDGDPAPLFHLIETETASEYTRADALLLLTVLVCRGRIPEGAAYDYLSGLAARFSQEASGEVWWGYSRAVAVLGFAGLAGAVEAGIDRIGAPDTEAAKAEFWRDLRETQAHGRVLSDSDWDRFEPFGKAVEQLAYLLDDTDEPTDPDIPEVADIQEPIRNPLRHIGRNDPCPCGSDKKYKKCCLQAGVA